MDQIAEQMQMDMTQDMFSFCRNQALQGRHDSGSVSGAQINVASNCLAKYLQLPNVIMQAANLGPP